MKRDMNRNTIQEVLGDLEARLDAYLVEWRRELGIENRNPRPASSPKSGIRQPPSGRRKV